MPYYLDGGRVCVLGVVEWGIYLWEQYVKDTQRECVQPRQRFSYYREMRGSVLHIIGESVTVNLDHVYLDNQSHCSHDVIEFQSESCATLIGHLRIP